MVGAVLALSAGVTACGDATAKTLDQPATESAVGRVVADRLGTVVRNTACPSTIPRGKNEVVKCSVTLSPKLGIVRVSVRQVDDEGRLDVVLLDAVIDNAEVTRTLKTQLKASFSRSFQADCGTGRRVVAPGGSFRCRARDRGGRRVVLVTVKDAAGTLAFRILP
jgi:hypothetical protein